MRGLSQVTVANRSQGAGEGYLRVDVTVFEAAVRLLWRLASNTNANAGLGLK